LIGERKVKKKKDLQPFRLFSFPTDFGWFFVFKAVSVSFLFSNRFRLILCFATGFGYIFDF